MSHLTGHLCKRVLKQASNFVAQLTVDVNGIRLVGFSGIIRLFALNCGCKTQQAEERMMPRNKEMDMVLTVCVDGYLYIHFLMEYFA